MTQATTFCKAGSVAQVGEGFKVQELEPFPPECNSMLEDLYHMGICMGKDIIILHANHADEPCKYLIIVNEKTGKRLKVFIE